jgi:glycosyltransferase involved in cell wall biosynthesis
MAAALSEDGYMVEVFGRKLRKSLPLEEVSFSHHRLWMVFRRGPLFYMFFNVRLFLSLLFRRRPSLLVAIDLDTLLANYLVSRIRKIPLLYDSHEYFTEVPELVDRLATKRIWEALEKRIVPRLKLGIAVSESIAKEYHDKYGTEFLVVRNVPEKKQPVPDKDFHDRFPAKYKIIYQGALNRGRGLELMISSMQQINDTSLLIAGDGDIRMELLKLTNDLNLSDRVFFLGRLLPDHLFKVTCQCSLGISLEEDLGLNYRMALPNKIFDYIQARIPVLCADLPEMAGMIEKWEVGEICRDRTPVALADQLNGMLRDIEKNRYWAGQLEKAAASLCWENEKPKLMEVVDRLV